MDTSDPRFIVECPDCGLDESTNDMDEALTFVSKHHEHTGHNAEWVEVELGDEFDIDLTSVWTVVCNHCDDVWEFYSEMEAAEFYFDHSQYTDHRANEPSESNRKTVSNDGVREFIREVGDHPDLQHGVPLPLLLKSLKEQGVDHSSVVEQVDKLKRRGEIYEPKTGYLQAT